MSYAERNSRGRYIPTAEAVELLVRLRPPAELGWRHAHMIATLWEDSGGYEWARPMVLKADPTHPAHLSVDRGIAQLNSYWWRDVPDSVAYSWPAAFDLVLRRLEYWSTVNFGDKGSTPWDWRPLLAWLWHAYNPDAPSYRSRLSHVRLELVDAGVSL